MVFPRGVQLLVMSQMQMRTGHRFDDCEQTIVPSVVFSVADAPTERNPLFRGPLPRQQNKSDFAAVQKDNATGWFSYWET